MAASGAQLAGRWVFEYAVVPFQQPEMLAAYQQGYAFETPLRAVSAGVQKGFLPGFGTFLQSSPDEFIISAVKACEDGNGWLARGYNLSDKEITVTLRTLMPFQRVEVVNLAEQAREPLVSSDHHTVQVTVKGNQVISLRFL
jgi:alpha-mannosidase